MSGLEQCEHLITAREGCDNSGFGLALVGLEEGFAFVGDEDFFEFDALEFSARNVLIIAVSAPRSLFTQATSRFGPFNIIATPPPAIGVQRSLTVGANKLFTMSNKK